MAGRCANSPGPAQEAQLPCIAHPNPARTSTRPGRRGDSRLELASTPDLEEARAPVHRPAASARSEEVDPRGLRVDAPRPPRPVLRPERRLTRSTSDSSRRSSTPSSTKARRPSRFETTWACCTRSSTHGVKRGWCEGNPVAFVDKPRIHRDRDIRFLTAP